MEKIKRLMVASLLLFAVCFSVYSFSKGEKTFFEFNMNSVEAMADDETGAYLTCYCAWWSDNNCAVNNNGSSVCAGGYNAHCWDYNRNCN